MRVVIDTNITISGLLFGGLPLKIVRMCLHRQFIWVISPPLIEELERVLSAKKFGLSQREIETLTRPIFDVVEVIVPVRNLTAIARCPGDNRVLECAVEGRCKFIITGDRRDLLGLRTYEGIDIVDARRFFETFLKGKE